MRRFLVGLCVACVFIGALSGVASAQPASEFRLGFKALADQIPDVAGQPLENEHWGANGDSLQQTSTGLMAWRKADNWTAFTNGSRTWVNGPFGVMERANDERFEWESPASGPNAPPAGASVPLRVHFIDIGQGDSILIQTPEGKAALIDGGSGGTGALQYLQGQGVQQLDLVVTTHPHEDHIGGLVEVLQAMPVAQVVTSGQMHTTLTYERFLDAITNAEAQYREVRRGDSLQLGSLTLEVLHPTTNTGANLNNQSVVLRLVHGQTSFLFMGDAEQPAEASILSSGLPFGTTVLKVGHHGSRTASSLAFLAAAKPQVAIYSAGAGNSYGHPHPETLATLASVGAAVYGTDTQGTVVVTSDGSGYSVATNRAGEPRAPPAAAPPAPSGVAVPAPVPAAGPSTDTAFSLEIASVTSPVRPGATATLAAKTAPGANCTITVYYKSGPSAAAGLTPKVADASGNVSWSWRVGTNTTPGTWRIVVAASKDGSSISREATFTVGG